MLFVPEKRARESLKKLANQQKERQKERNKELRAKALKYSKEFDKKHGL